MLSMQTVDIPHLGGITASYAFSAPTGKPDPSKPTLLLVNSFTATAELYAPQFANHALTSKVELLAVELLGHGGTRARKSENWTYWDSAIMNLMVLEKLGITRAFVAGTSQGGWVAMRMAILAPEKILGVIPIGTSMDAETQRTRDLGCWDGHAAASGPISLCTSATPTPEFEPGNEYSDYLIDVGFGKDCSQEVREYWRKTIGDNYRGDEGRKRLRMAAINLAQRDSLHARLDYVVCPVLWLHGTSDVVYSVANAEEEIKLFVNSPDARLVPIKGGHHFLSASHPAEVDRHILELVTKHHLPSPVPPGTPDVAERAVSPI